MPCVPWQYLVSFISVSYGSSAVTDAGVESCHLCTVKGTEDGERQPSAARAQKASVGSHARKFDGMYKRAVSGNRCSAYRQDANVSMDSMIAQKLPNGGNILTPQRQHNRKGG